MIFNIQILPSQVHVNNKSLKVFFIDLHKKVPETVKHQRNTSTLVISKPSTHRKKKKHQHVDRLTRLTLQQLNVTQAAFWCHLRIL